MATQLRAKLVFYDVPAANVDQSRRFYAALLGSEPAPAPLGRKDHHEYFQPISPDGIDLTLHQKRDQNPPDIPIAFFAVDNLEAARKQLEELGGKVVHGPVDIPLPQGRGGELFAQSAKEANQVVGHRLGQAYTMIDPAKNPLGIVQLEGPAQRYFRVGRFAEGLREDQVQGHKLALESSA
jgi:predicted enzyme related to lactoylglutathione lyase